jgi:hypothetical protein
VRHEAIAVDDLVVIPPHEAHVDQAIQIVVDRFSEARDPLEP